MHILHCISGLSVGGAELALYRMVVECLADEGNDVTVVAFSKGGQIADDLASRGVRVVTMDFRDSPILSFIKLRRLVLEHAPDVVQTWMYHADLLGGLAARSAGCKALVWGIRTTHLPEGGSRLTRLIRRACARLSRWIPAAIVCAADASRALHGQLGYAQDKMVVIPNGYDFSRLIIDPKARPRLRTEWGIPADAPLIGMVGRFSIDKDPENFVQAAAQIGARIPNARFLMVGRGQEWANPELSSWIRGAGLAERFILVGERSDVPDLLSTMDVFCLPSRTEGFPNVVAEAMACGLPCVVTDVGDAAVLLGQAGLVVPPRDSLALAEALGQLLSLAPEARADLGALGRARVNSEYTIQRTCERYQAVYEKVIAEGRS